MDEAVRARKINAKKRDLVQQEKLLCSLLTPVTIEVYYWYAGVCVEFGAN